MAKKLKTDSAIEQAWYRLASGIQVNMMDIPKIFKECREAMQSGQSVEDVVKAAIAKYRLN
jgi:hypothetical protein